MVGSFFIFEFVENGVEVGGIINLLNLYWSPVLLSNTRRCVSVDGDGLTHLVQTLV